MDPNNEEEVKEFFKHLGATASMLLQQMDEFTMQLFYEDLQEFTLDEVIDALRDFRKDPERGYFKLTVADVILHIRKARERKACRLFYLPDPERPMLPAGDRPRIGSLQELTAHIRERFGARHRPAKEEPKKPEYRPETPEEIEAAARRKERLKATLRAQEARHTPGEGDHV